MKNTVPNPTKICHRRRSPQLRKCLDPKSINGGAPKFSASVLIPKSDTATLQKIKAAIQAAYDEGESKLKGSGKSIPALSTLKTPLRNGDEERPDDEAYAGHWFINANSNTAPGVVDINRQPILDTSEIYSGVYARVSLSFYAYSASGNRGIACGLQNIQKIRDGASLGGKANAEDDFVKRITGLTGTPSSNGLMDLWAEFRLLDMGKRLGRFITHFRETYFVPDKRNQQIVFSYKPKPGAEDAIYRLVSDITISMKSADYLKMPGCVINEVPVRLSEKELKCYETLKDELILSLNGQDIDAKSAVGLSNKLTQMANGAVYGEENTVIPVHDRKLDALEDLLEAANGKPVLVAYWFTARSLPHRGAPAQAAYSVLQAGYRREHQALE
jgi:hypothetical protein